MQINKILLFTGVVDNDVVKKTIYNQLITLITKVNGIWENFHSTFEFINKSQHDSNKQILEKILKMLIKK